VKPYPGGPQRNTRAKKWAYFIERRHVRRVRKRMLAAFDLTQWGK
jgi:hypothetical protein